MKKLKFSFFTIILVSILSCMLMSCSEEQDPISGNVENIKNKVQISFDVEQKNMTTRSQNNINEFQIMGYFDNVGKLMPDVEAYLGDVEAYLGYEDNNSYKPVDIIYNGSSWDYKNKTDMTYWPNGNLNFYATANFDFSKAKMHKQNGIKYFSLNIPSDITQQKDIMIATSYDVAKNTNNGKVNLTFYHILDKILFKAYLADPSYDIEIKDIIIHNAMDSVNYIPQCFKVAGIKKTLGMPPYSLNPHRSNYSLRMSTPIRIATINQENAVLLNSFPLYLPVDATLDEWKDKKTIPEADANKEAYLEIIYRFKINGKQIVPQTGDGYGSTYIPFSFKGNHPNGFGNQVTIYLKMGGGYDSNHKPIVENIPTRSFLDLK